MATIKMNKIHTPTSLKKNDKILYVIRKKKPRQVGGKITMIHTIQVD